MASLSQPAFSLNQTTTTDGVVVSLSGELDLQVAPQVADVIRENLDAGRRQTVDLSEVTFMDSTGLAALVTSVHDLQARERMIIKRSRHPQPNRLLELTGTAAYLPLA